MKKTEQSTDAGRVGSSDGLEIGSCRIRGEELMSLPTEGYSAHLTSLLRKRGVPVTGVLLPKLHPDYKYEWDLDKETGDVLYKWRKVSNARHDPHAENETTETLK